MPALRPSRVLVDTFVKGPAEPLAALPAEGVLQEVDGPPEGVAALRAVEEGHLEEGGHLRLYLPAVFRAEGVSVLW